MKRKHIIVCTLLSLLLTGCNGSGVSKLQGGECCADSTDMCMSEATAETEEPIEVSMNGNISPDTWTPGEEATVTFSHFPTTVAGFRQIQEQIGNTPQGAVALQLIAFEMYNKNTAVGTECISLNNTEINIPSVMRRMPEIFNKHNAEDSYGRLHLVATYLEGATPENGFNPTRPYTVRVRSSKVRDYERSESLKGYVLYLEVFSNGYDTSWRGCDVIKQKGSDYYKVNNSPSMYVQCKEVPFDAKEDYKGI